MPGCRLQGGHEGRILGGKPIPRNQVAQFVPKDHVHVGGHVRGVRIRM